MGERRSALGLWSRAVLAAWDWRLEVALGIGVLVLTRLGLAVGNGGPVLLFGLGGIALWRVPRLRRGLLEALRRTSVQRWCNRALRGCGVTGPAGASALVRHVASVPCGYVLRVQVPVGLHPGDLETLAPSLAAALRVREVRVTKDPADSGIAQVVVVRRDPFAGTSLPWAWADRSVTSSWEPVPLGVDEVGAPVHLTLPEHNLLLGGEPGAGKSTALALLVAACALDPTVGLTLLDGKQVELAAWQDSAEQFVGPDPAAALDVLDDLRGEMERRYATLLSAGRRKVERSDGLGLHVVVIDELAFYLRGGKREVRTELTEALRDLVSRGRAAGTIVLAATQKPGHEIIPTWIRDLFSFRLALRCTTPEASDTVLGQGWASRGYSAASIDPATRGVGYLLAEGGIPVQCRTAHLTDIDVAAIARRAATLRGRP